MTILPTKVRKVSASVSLRTMLIVHSFEACTIFEVRNPISSAMTACSFVKSEITKEEPFASEAARNTTIQDVTIIDNSLKFVNDLLRTMLDIHRAADKQLSLNMVPTDILHDVLEPVEGMLVQKGGKVAVSVDCPRDLFAVTDSLRLKQVILNLGRNSSKFVDKGFIRLSGAVVMVSRLRTRDTSRETGEAVLEVSGEP